MSLCLSSSFFWRNRTRYTMHRIRLRVAFLLVSVIIAEIAETNTSFLTCLFWAQSNSSSSAFLITVEILDLGYVFPSLIISAGGRGGANVLSTLVLLLIQMSILFLLSLSLFVRGFTASGEQRVGRLWCRRRRKFFDKVVAAVSGEGGL